MTYVDGDPQVITCYPSHSGVSNGTITTGNFVGTFSADIRAKENNECQGKLIYRSREDIDAFLEESQLWRDILTDDQVRMLALPWKKLNGFIL